MLFPLALLSPCSHSFFLGGFLFSIGHSICAVSCTISCPTKDPTISSLLVGYSIRNLAFYSCSSTKLKQTLLVLDYAVLSSTFVQTLYVPNLIQKNQPLTFHLEAKWLSHWNGSNSLLTIAHAADGPGVDMGTLDTIIVLDPCENLGDGVRVSIL